MKAHETQAAKKHMTTYGFAQFAGEGPLFYMRQFGGFVICSIGAIILFSSYNEDWKFLPVSTSTASYIALFVMGVGAIVHEIRPFRVSC